MLADALVEAPGVRGVGPLALGGFRFDPSAGVSDEWRDYGDGFLVLPRVSYSKMGEGTWVTENTIVQPDSGPGRLSSDGFQWGNGPVMPAWPPIPAEGQEADLNRWMTSVRQAVGLIRRGELEKVVLARRLRANTIGPGSIEKALRRLIESDPQCTVFALANKWTVFLGATPETLVKIGDGRVESVCLAGSAPRGSTPEEDQHLGESLLKDAKELGEHSLVVEQVAGSMKYLCSDLRWSETPAILRLGNIQHLSTRFEGVNSSGAHVLDYVERLHPTPAVAGSPKREAMRIIREMEEMDRGWYAGPLGWMDGSGRGEFTVAIRSALVGPRDAILYAGAGIVGASDPAREYAETGFKLRTLLSALDIED